MNLHSSTSILLLILCLGFSSNPLLAQLDPCPPNLIESITVNNISCDEPESGSINVLINDEQLGNFSYVWSNPEFGNTPFVSGLGQGTYGLNLSFGENEGCVVSDNLVIGPVSEVDIVLCNTFAATDGTQGITLRYEGGAFPFTINIAGPTDTTITGYNDDFFSITGLLFGTYDIMVIGSNGCFDTCSGQLECQLAFGIPTVNNPSCAGIDDGSISVTVSSATGDVSYSWSNGESTAAIAGLSTGNYLVTVSDAICSEVLSFALISPPVLQVESSITEPACAGDNSGSITLQAIGGTPPYSYNWEPSSIANVPNAEALTAGDYSVTIEDAQECTITQTFTLEAPSPISLNCVELSIEDMEIITDENRSVLIGIDGGTAPYIVTYTGPTPGTSNPEGNIATINNLKTGTYTFTVTDDRGCSETCSIELECLLDGTGTPEDPSCFEGDDGQVFYSFVNSVGSPSFQWSNAATSQNLNGVLAGVYVVTVTDEANCQNITEVVVSNPAQLQLTLSEAAPDKSTEEDNGQARVTISGGKAPYRLQLNGPRIDTLINPISDASIVEGLADGYYTATLTDAEGCEVEGTLNIRRVFVVEKDDLYLVQFEEDTPLDSIRKVEEYLKTNESVKKKACNCKGEKEFLQLWEAKESLEINASKQGAEEPPEVDTSGLGVLFLWQDAPGQVQQGDCVESPGVSSQNAPQSVKVAIIDSGSNVESELHDYTHPKLTNVTWKNKGEPLNGRDDDENCNVDDLEGYDFLTQSHKVIDTLVGHGTHIAGIIADGYPEHIKLEIMNLKVFTQDEVDEQIESRGGVFDLICAIHYAVNHGADVINLSLGYEDRRPSPALHYALKRAEAAGIVVVASSGNNGRDLNKSFYQHPDSTRWPVSFKKDIVLMDTTFEAVSNMLVIGGLDNEEEDIDTRYSNYGNEFVDAVARGTFESTHLGDSYLTLEGTSMSTGEVSRMVSLIKADNSMWMPEQIIETIRNTIEPIPSRSLVDFGGRVNIPAVLKEFNIAIDRKTPADPPGRGDILWGDIQFRADEKVDLEIYLNRNDTSQVYDQVFFRVEELPNPGIIYSKEYCSTNKITWDGTLNNGKEIESSRNNRFLYITIGNQEYQIILVK